MNALCRQSALIVFVAATNQGPRLMYEAFFGLRRRPFAASPDADCFASVGSAERALAELFVCLQGGRGIAVLAAAAGMGKTLVCRRLVRDLGDEWATVMLTHAGFPTRRSLLQAILYELGRPYARMGDQELRLELQTAAREVRPERRGVVLIIDEAHLLSERLLEEVRSITNLTDGRTPLMHVLLSGQPSLDETLAAPGLEAFRQRIGCQVTLESLTQAESLAYLAHGSDWAGVTLDGLFTPDAARLIAHASDGLPRCLNQLADHSLLLGCVTETRPVNEEVVRQSLDDLRQLPLHWNAPARVPSPLEQLRAQCSQEDPRVPVADAARQDNDSSATCAAIEVGCEPTPSSSRFDLRGSRMAEPAIAAVKTGDTAWPSDAAAAVVEIGEECEECGDDRSIPVASAAAAGDRIEETLDEVLCDPWQTDVLGREIFEAMPGDETPPTMAEAPVAPLTSDADGADEADGAQAASSSRRAEHEVAASVEPVKQVEEAGDPAARSRPRSAPGRTARTGRPHFVPSVAPSAKPPKPPRPSSPAADHTTAGPAEEWVFDRYALLDAGQSLPPDVPAHATATRAFEPAPREDEQWLAYGEISTLRPDERIDWIAPLLEEALAIDAKPRGAPPEAAACSRPETSGSVPRETASDFPASLRFNVVHGDDEIEERIGEELLQSCLEAQRALGSRAIGPQDHGGPTATATFDAIERSPAPKPEPPVNEAPRQYSQLFSALRKKFRRPA